MFEQGAQMAVSNYNEPFVADLTRIRNSCEAELVRPQRFPSLVVREAPRGSSAHRFG